MDRNLETRFMSSNVPPIPLVTVWCQGKCRHQALALAATVWCSEIGATRKAAHHLGDRLAGLDRKLGKDWFRRRHNARQMVKGALVRAASAPCRAETTDGDPHRFWGSQKTMGERGCPK